jgi:hypothetical protein
MIIVPGKMIFLETPRTGSRATAEAFMKYVPNAFRTNERHLHPDNVPRETSLPIFTFTRDPVKHAYSWYKYGLDEKFEWAFIKNGTRPMTFSEFLIAPFDVLPEFKTSRLNIYHNVADYFWPLERGVTTFFLFVLNLHAESEIVGKTSVQAPVEEIHERLVEAKFHKDCEMWREKRGNWEKLRNLIT